MSVHANYFTLQLTVPEDRQVLPWLVFDYIKKVIAALRLSFSGMEWRYMLANDLKGFFISCYETAQAALEFKEDFCSRKHILPDHSAMYVLILYI